MEKFLDKFGKIPLQQRILGTVGICLITAVAVFATLIMPLTEKITQLDGDISEQDKKIKDLSNKAEHRVDLMKEVEKLRQRLREAEEQLPKQAEIPKLLRDIDYEARQSGLNIEKFEPQAEQLQGDFAKVPLKMAVTGNYHEIAVFLDRISKMPRIVNVSDITMNTPKEIDQKMIVKSTYTATTYRFLEKKKEDKADKDDKKGKDDKKKDDKKKAEE